MRPVATILVIAALVAGCGGDSGDTVSTEAVIDGFEQRTGVTLVRERHNPSPGAVQALSPHRGADPEDKYGAFTIYVMQDGHDGSTLLDDEAGNKITPVNGLYWERSTDAEGGFWSATKRYHDNVYLSWIGGTRKRTTRKFERLDSALRQIAS